MTDRIENLVLTPVAAALERIGVRRGELLVVALSGGRDSVALLRVLLELKPRFGYRLAAAHLNHGLRGEESERDEAFVRRLCNRWGVRLLAERARGLANGAANLEERARRARQEFFARISQRLNAGHVALAHHAGDQAETVLLRLLRGTGTHGLAAMAEAGPANLIRPMLRVESPAIARYLAHLGQRFIVDSSNVSPKFMRNRVRNDLIPTLERGYVPGVIKRLADLAAEMRDIDALTGEMANRELDRVESSSEVLSVDLLASLQPALQIPVLRQFVIRRLGQVRRISRRTWEAMRRLAVYGPPNGSVDLPGGVRLEREYGLLRLATGRPPPTARYRRVLEPRGVTVIRAAGLVLEAETIAPAEARLPESPFEAMFDAEEVDGRLVVRNFVTGDRIRPLGMMGHRKVKELFVDLKVPRARRASFAVVTLNDEIVWLPGLRRGHGGTVNKSTRRVLRIRASLIESQKGATLRENPAA